MGYSIRKAVLDDLKTVQSLSINLSEKEADEFDPTLEPGWNRSEEAVTYLEEKIVGEESMALVAETEDKTVGYIVASIKDAEVYRKMDKIAEIESMYILPEYRSNGIGSEFVQKFFTWAEDRDVDRLRVEATSQNTDGISFYRENGFEDYSLTLEKNL